MPLRDESATAREVEDLVRRALSTTDNAVVNLMLGLMRETRDSVVALNDNVNKRFDQLARERREEAEQSGSHKARLARVEDNQRFTRNLAGTAVIGMIIQFFVLMLGRKQ